MVSAYRMLYSLARVWADPIEEFLFFSNFVFLFLSSSFFPNSNLKNVQIQKMFKIQIIFKIGKSSYSKNLSNLKIIQILKSFTLKKIKLNFSQKLKVEIRKKKFQI
jgi:hypothetical protein